LEEKLKTSQDRLRNKTLQVEQMYGRPMDDLVRRERESIQVPVKLRSLTRSSGSLTRTKRS